MFRAVLKEKVLVHRFQYLQQASATTVVSANRSDVQPFSKIPKIPTIPFLGSGWVYLPVVGKYNFKKMHLANQEKFRQYGPVVLESFSSRLQAVLLFDAKDVEKVYRNEGRNPNRLELQSFKKYRDSKKHLYKNGGLLTTQGNEWWEVRSQTQPHVMKPKAILAYLEAMDSVAKQFTDRMVHLRGKDGGEVPDYLPELTKWALESVALVFLDTRLGCIEKNPNQSALQMITAVNEIFTQLSKLEFGASGLWRIFPTPTWRKFEKHMDYFSKETFDRISEAKKRLDQAPPDHEPTLLELVISTTKDPRDVNAMITDMIFGGVDTTSTAVGLALYHLAKNPEVQEKAYQEIKSNIKGTSLTAQDLNNIPYLKACMKETMRLTPLVIGNFRKLPETTVLSGYEIPAGTHVFPQQYAIGRMEKYFPEPLKFRPERFLRGEAEHDPFAYLPFGFGPRSCIGQRIANQEIWTLLIRTIERFRVEYHHEDIGLEFRTVNSPDKPLRLQFYDR